MQSRFSSAVDATVAVGDVGSRLTTQFEAQAQAAMAAGRQVAGATGLTGKALDRATASASAMQMGIGLSAEASGAASAQFELNAKALKAVGIQSDVVLAKLQDLGWANANQFSNQLKKAQTELGYNADQLKDLGMELVSTGRTLQDMKAPFGQLDDLLAIGSRRSSLFARGFQTIGAPGMIKGMLRAEKALFVLTNDAKMSQEAMLKLGSASTESLETLGDALGGVGDGISDMTKGVAISSGDILKTFQLMQTSPDKFVEEFGKMSMNIKKSSKSSAAFLNLLATQVKSTLGTDVSAFLINAFNKVDDSKLKAIEATKVLKGDITQAVNEVYRSTKTLQDRFNLVMGAGLAKFREIGLPAAKQFVDDTQKAYGKFNDTVAKMVKSGSPLGKILETVSKMSLLGPLALLPTTLRPAAAIFSDVAKQVGDAYGVFEKFTGAVTGLLSPMTLLVGIGAALYLGLTHFKSMGKSAADFADYLKKSMHDAINAVHNFITSFATDAESMLPKEITEIWGVIKSVWADIPWSQLWDIVLAGWHILKDFWDKTLKPWWDDTAVPALKAFWEGSLKPWITGVFVPEAKAALSAMWDGFKTVWDDILKPIWDNDIKPKLIAAIEETGKDLIVAMAKSIANTAVNSIAGGMVGFVRKSVSQIKDARGTNEAGAESAALMARERGGRELPQGSGDVGGGLKELDAYKPAAGQKMSEAVATSYTKTAESAVKAVDTIQAKIEKGFTDPVTTAMPKAFDDGFAKVTDKSKAFFDKEIKAFDGFAVSVYRIFNAMWIKILQETDLAVKATSASTKDAMSDMAKLKDALNEVRQAKNEKGVNSTPASYKTDDKAEAQTAILQKATDWPQWYQSDFKDLFRDKLDRLITATESAGVASAVKAGNIIPSFQQNRLNTKTMQQPGISPINGLGPEGQGG